VINLAGWHSRLGNCTRLEGQAIRTVFIRNTPCTLNILSHPGPQPRPNSEQVRDGDGEYDTYHELSVTGIKVGSCADPASFAFCVINGIGPCFFWLSKACHSLFGAYLLPMILLVSL